MDDQMKEKIEAIIGRRISWDQRNTVTDLNSISLALVEDVRILPTLLRWAYLWFVVDHRLHPYIPLFIDEVVEKGTPPTVWGRGGIVIPSYTLPVLLQLSSAQILSPLGRSSGEPWHQVMPDPRFWEVSGAPALLRKELPYNWIPPERATRIRPSAVKLTAVHDVVVATRRWISTQFATVAGKWLDSIHDVDLLMNLAVPDVRTLSEDARIAITALLAEKHLLAPSDSEIAGFRGPDSWYEGNPPS